MTPKIKESGPKPVVRPFVPTKGGGTAYDERTLGAIEHIAVSLSGIDHNLEMIGKALSQQIKMQEELMTRLIK